MAQQQFFFVSPRDMFQANHYKVIKHDLKYLRLFCIEKRYLLHKTAHNQNNIDNIWQNVYHFDEESCDQV